MIIVVLLISIVLLIINVFLVARDNYIEKISPYECGFQPFNNILNNFDIKYYLIALLFLLFDLEVMFLIPWVSSMDIITGVGLFSMLFFYFILFLGFFYEWYKGGLEWN